MIRLPRKLKKKIIKVFGRNTYYGIINGYLNFDKYSNNLGVITVYTGKPFDKGSKILVPGECNPYLYFPKIKH